MNESKCDFCGSRIEIKYTEGGNKWSWYCDNCKRGGGGGGGRVGGGSGY
jgi:hypothetical protein